MEYRVTTAVATEPVTRTEAKVHLRVDSTVEDTMIDGLITAARETAEHYTGRALAPQTLEVALDCFPSYENDAITLPRCPVTSITSVKYTDTDGVEQTLSSTKYALSPYGESRILAPTFGNYWPTTQDIMNSVRIVQVCGYTTCPKAAKQAILLLIGHLYENRQDVSAMKLEEIPNGARSLLDTIKVYGY